MSAQNPSVSVGLTTQAVPSTVTDRRLRVRAIPILVLLVGEILLGNQLAVVGSPYPVGYLVAHIIIAVLLVGLSGHAVMISLRLPSRLARVAAVITLVAALGATISGTLFLVAGQSNGALYGMEGLGGVAFLSGILLLVCGSMKVPAPSA